MLQVDVDVSSGSVRVELADLGRDAGLGLAVNDWVELTDEASVLHNRAAPLLRVVDIDRETMAVTLEGKTKINNAGRNLVLRRWDHYADSKHGDALPVKENEWITLEDGVQVLFEPAEVIDPKREYRTGDFWLIPARTATGNVEWPSERDVEGLPKTDLPAALPPRGPRHSYAPLAVQINSDGNSHFTDCRYHFTPLGVSQP